MLQPGGTDEAASATGQSRGAVGQEYAGSGDLRPIPEIRTVPGPVGRPPRETPGGEAAPPADGDGADREETGPAELVLADLEGQLRWQPVSWDNANDCDMSVETREGGKALVLKCKAGEADKAGATIEFKPSADLSSYDAVVLRLRVVSGSPREITLAWQTDGYYEAMPKKLTGESGGTVTFPLRTRTYKTKPTWEHTSELRARRATRALFVLVYYDKPCALEIDSVLAVRTGSNPADTGGNGIR